ncbi:SPASM domain-containing protein [Oscillochloris sp. ZM17-4]|uniref:radical SAM/SPASM domain-containing protein n=1 Tax=Oscillochloris sp. ZM17-4 TaxID=2866714 RepID=UPI001C73DEB7|nr:radical SAM protein [Oscillochloris sp. ZM17-4]MBX0328221.1 SPASM domain-containing protein [Oscillochloris sp. ZM17-4]
MPIARALPDLMHRQMIPHAEIFTADCDCDCSLGLDDTSTNTFVPGISVPLPAQLQQAPGLYRDQLSDGREFVFNPLSAAGVIVLTPRAAHLLDSFALPQQIAATDTPQVSGAHAVIAQLAAYDLLIEPGRELMPIFQPAKTLAAWLHSTNDCNLRCSYCYIRKTADRMSHEVGRHTIDMLFASAEQHGFSKVKLKFSGGEALLNLSLVLSLNAYAQEKAAISSVSVQSLVLSNGIAISASTARKLREQGIGICISLDGIGAHHDAERRLVNGGGSFVYVQRGIQTLLEAGLVPTIAITVSEYTLDGLPQLFDYLLDLDLPFTLSFYREHEQSACETHLRFGEQHIIAALLAALSHIEQRLPRRSLLESLVDKANFLAAHDHTCAAGSSYLVVDQHGQIAKCPMEIERPITTIFAADPLHELRSSVIGLQNVSVDAKEGCQSCTWRYWCAGGCPVQTYRATGRYDIRSPNCAIYKALFPALLRLEALRIATFAPEYSAPNPVERAAA